MNVLFMSIVPYGAMYLTLADEFRNQGHKVMFVTPTEGKTRIDHFKNHRILYFHAGKMLNVSIPRKGINNLLFPIYALRAVKEYVTPNDYQLILMTTPPLGYLSSIQFIKRKNPDIKFYEILRDIHPEGSKHILKKLPGLYGFFKRQAAALYNIADGIGCMSPHSVNLIQEGYLPEKRNKVYLLPNWGEKISYQAPTRAVLKRYNLEGKFVIIYGGNMGKPQNLPLFLKLAKDKQKLTDVLFLFIGEGTEREYLRDIVKRENITNVKIENSIPHEDYLDLLKSASVGIITLSPIMFFANCPSKAVSYWQNKIPILASLDAVTDFGSYFLDRSKSGLWSLATDYDTLSKNFDILYYNSELRNQMGENGYIFYKNNFTVERTYNSIVTSMGFK